MMGAYEELSAGTIGEQTARLVYETVDAVARLHRFPAPEGTDRWDANAVQDVAHDFMSRNDFGTLRQLAATATNEGSFERLLDKAVHNHLRDLARTTVAGRLSRSITYRLESMSDVRRLTGAGSSAIWILDGADSEATAATVDDLIAAAYELTGLAAVRTVAGPQRGTALIDPMSLEAVLRAVLVAAGGPVESSALLEVVTARFPMLIGDNDMPLDDATDLPDHKSGGVLESGPVVDQVWSQLDRVERLVLPAVDGSATVRDLAAELGVSKSSVQRAVARAKVVLATALLDADDASEVVRELLLRSGEWGGGTIEARSASSSDTGGTL